MRIPVARPRDVMALESIGLKATARAAKRVAEIEDQNKS